MYDSEVHMMAVEGVSDGRLGMGTDDDWRVLPGDGEVARRGIVCRVWDRPEERWGTWIAQGGRGDGGGRVGVVAAGYLLDGASGRRACAGCQRSSPGYVPRILRCCRDVRMLAAAFSL